MTKSATEALHPQAKGLETKASPEILHLLLRGQIDALESLTQAVTALEAGAERLASTIRNSGRIIYCGAGSSGMAALNDGLELPGTFGIDQERINFCIAGGTETLDRLDSRAEDDPEVGKLAFLALQATSMDTLVAVSASGATPYTVAAARQARESGTTVIALANNAVAPLLSLADIPVLVATPPELVAGSTRLGAGSAQKAALNMMSTLMAIRLGLTHDGQMVNLNVENQKLRRRALGMITRIGGVDAVEADRALDLAAGVVPVAILLARGIGDPDQARAILDQAEGNLTRALADWQR